MPAEGQGLWLPLGDLDLLYLSRSNGVGAPGAVAAGAPQGHGVRTRIGGGAAADGVAAKGLPGIGSRQLGPLCLAVVSKLGLAQAHHIAHIGQQRLIAAGSHPVHIVAGQVRICIHAVVQPVLVVVAVHRLQIRVIF